ncbi:MAG: SgcJ/EcaC family oxidoreductase [Eubacteriaceae bacterium]
MKFSTIIAITIFVMLNVGSIGQAEPIKYISQRTVDAVVKEIDDEYVQAFGARDAKACAKLFTENATLYSGGSVLSGQITIEKIVSNSWTCIPEGTKLEIVPITSTQVASDVIVTHSISYITSPGVPMEIYAYTMVLMKEENDWKIAANQTTRLDNKVGKRDE